jgi:replicative DNA helicase
VTVPEHDDQETGGAVIDPAVLFSERECLGAAMRSPEALEVVLGTLEDTDYVLSKHQVIHQVLLERALAGEPCDELSVLGDLTRRPAVPSLGERGPRLVESVGAAYLHDLVWRSGAGSIGHHIEVVRHAALRREVAARAETLRRLAVNPGADLEDVEREAREVLDRLRAPWGGGLRWPIPRPLAQELPVLPVTALAGPVQRIVTAVSASTQTPPDLAAFTALGTLSAATRGSWEVHADGGWTEQTVLYLAALAESSERKSAVLKAVAGALRDLEVEVRATEHEDFSGRFARYQVMEKRAAAARDRAAKAGTKEEFEQAMTEVKDITSEFDSMARPEIFRLTCGDITPEALTALMAAQGGAMAVLAAEGGLLSTLAGRYAKDGADNIDLVLSAYMGESVQSDRISRGHSDIPRPILTIALLVQPYVVAQALKQQAFVDKGLMGRFLYALPESRVGTRALRAPEIAPEATAEWHAVVGKIFEAGRTISRSGEVGSIRLDREAQAVFDVWRDGHEPRLRKDLGDLGDLRAWGGKLPGNLLRIAALFALAERPRDDRPLISEADMRGAVDLAPYLIKHAREVLLGADGGRRDQLEHVLASFRRFARDHDHTNTTTSSGSEVGSNGELSLSLRDIYHSVNGRSWVKAVGDVEEVLTRLGDLGYVRRLPPPPARGGRPPSPRYLVNPRFVTAPGTT